MTPCLTFIQEKQASNQITHVYQCVHSGVYCAQALVSGVCSLQCVQTLPAVWDALESHGLSSIKNRPLFPTERRMGHPY